MFLSIFYIYSLDPSNRKAVAGLIATGQTLNANSAQANSTTSDSEGDEPIDEPEQAFEMVEIPPGVDDNDIDGESEVETQWSDVEIEASTT